MQRLPALLGSSVFLVIAPGTLAVYAPWAISRWRVQPVSAPWIPVRIFGEALAAFGAVLLIDCFMRFALQGRGTPAPVAPPNKLVISGMYRYLRNPMYVAVFSLVLGQGLWFANRQLVEYALLLWAGFTAFEMLYEEPTLRSKFGAEYEAYCRRVNRWIPSFRRNP